MFTPLVYAANSRLNIFCTRSEPLPARGFRSDESANFLFLRVLLRFEEAKEFRPLRRSGQGVAPTPHDL